MTRQEVVALRLTEEEKKALQEYADNKMLPVASLVRQIVMTAVHAND